MMPAESGAARESSAADVEQAARDEWFDEPYRLAEAICKARHREIHDDAMLTGFLTDDGFVVSCAGCKMISRTVRRALADAGLLHTDTEDAPCEVEGCDRTASAVSRRCTYHAVTHVDFDDFDDEPLTARPVVGGREAVARWLHPLLHHARECIHLNVETCPEWPNALRYAAEAPDAVLAALPDRDETREQVERWQQKWKRRGDVIEGLKVQRDGYRELAEELLTDRDKALPDRDETRDTAVCIACGVERPDWFCAACGGYNFDRADAPEDTRGTDE